MHSRSKALIHKDPAPAASMDLGGTTDQTTMTPNSFPKRHDAALILLISKHYLAQLAIQLRLKKQNLQTMHQRIKAFLLRPFHTTAGNLQLRLST